MKSTPSLNSDKVTERINAKALELLVSNPEGLRTTQLLRAIEEFDPTLHPKTINGCVWLLVENFPESVYKPERGLFMHTKYRND